MSRSAILLSCYAVCWNSLFITGALSAAADPIVWRLDNLNRIGGVDVEVLGAPKLVDGALGFDGAHDGIFLPVIPIAGWSEFTVEILFTPAGDGPAAQRFVHLQDEAGSRLLIETRLDGKGGWSLDTFLWTPTSQRTLLDLKQVHPTDRAYWVALRCDGKRMSAFVNREKQGEGPVKFPPLGAGRTSLGVRQNKVYWFKGTIAEVRFTPSALPEDKLQRAE